MKIELKWDDFTNPSIDDVREFNLKYPNVKNCSLESIRQRSEVYTQKNIEKYFDSFFKQKEELKYINEINQHVGIAKLYITNLWYHSSQKPNRCKGGKSSASSMSYETCYEIIYSKLSSSFDRFLHLVNIYYSLGLASRDVTISKVKKSICDHYKDEALSQIFCNLTTNNHYKRISRIRNSFIHRELIFEQSIKFNNTGQAYDSFQYKNKMDATIMNFIKYVDFLNTKALPFLYDFQRFEKHN